MEAVDALEAKLSEEVDDVIIFYRETNNSFFNKKTAAIFN
jgi:hypothetical protein